jgi:hypothetical protein
MSAVRAAHWLAALAVGVSFFAHAQQTPYVPPELEPWRAWVLHGEGERECPFLFDEKPEESAAHRCAWPGLLQLDVSAGGARFTQSWVVYTAGWAPLPGDEETWPMDVTEAGKALPVTAQESPSVWLEPGRHQLNGRFQWERMPATLAIPERTGLVALALDGHVVDRPQRTADTLWLGQRQETLAPEADALRVQVFRLLNDGIPFTMTTRVQLDVAGAGREVLLGRAGPAGFVPVELTSDVPARIESDGRLRVQLRPGTWHLELRSRAEALPEQVAFDPGEGDWADEEIWSYESDESLRVTVPEGTNAVDPAQVGVPAEWQASPSFRLARGDTLRIVERSRGVPAALENRLTLERSLWRDYDGAGYTIVDALSGQMDTGWRLDMRTPYRLGSAQAGGKDLLVTQGSAPELAGVEVRDKALSLRALSRLESADSHLPATGWQQRFESARLTLHLPAGQRLLAAPGADDAPDTWLHVWRLLDFFLVLFIALAVGRLLSPLYGGIALAMLILTYQEPGAPVWIWLALLLAVALVRFAPEGQLLRAARTLRLAAFLALAFVAVPFIAMQLRAALYPQLDPQAYWGMYARNYEAMPATAPVAAPAPVRSAEPEIARDMATSEVGAPEEMVVTATKRAEPFRHERLDYAPSVLLQSGPAVPQWNGIVYQLGWSGPVSADDDLRLIILGTFAYRLVRVLSVLLIGALVWALTRLSFGKLRWPPALAMGTGTSTVLAGIAIAPLLLTPHGARADTPDPALLQELKQRLLESPKCAPQCAALARARAHVDGDVLTLDLDVQAQARVAFPVPGAMRGWEPARVTVDGVAREWLYRDGEQLLIVLDEGAHAVQLSGPLPPTATVHIPFPEPPHYIEVDARGWTASGVADGRLASGALALERSTGKDAQQADQNAPLVAGSVAPFVRVTRTVMLDVDWAVVTRVERIAPADGAFTVEIPLLPGEAVTAGVPVRDGRLLASFDAESGEFSWNSTLAQSQNISLIAGDGKGYAEVWRLEVGPAWRIMHEGTPLIASEGSSWAPEFHPRQGETIALEVSRPAALEGSTLTFESAALRTTAGQRVVDSQLDLRYRSTRGGTHALHLPPAARVVAVMSDGETLSGRPDEGELTLPIRPGEHTVSVTFQEERGAACSRTRRRSISAPRAATCPSRSRSALNAGCCSRAGRGKVLPCCSGVS